MDSSEIPVDMPTLNQCVAQASQVHQIHPSIIKTIIAVEGGQIGTLRPNTNKSFDLGVMQINTINVPDINMRFGYSAKDLVLDPCKNIMAGTWLLWKRIQEVPGRLWVGVGNYHSKTSRHRHRYLQKVEQAYARLGPVLGKPEEAKAIGRTTNWGRPTNATTQAAIAASAGKPAFPSIKEMESMVEQGSSAPTLVSHAHAIPSLPVLAATTKINTKRKALRFID